MLLLNFVPQVGLEPNTAKWPSGLKPDVATNYTIGA